MDEEGTVLRSGPLIDPTAIFLVVFTIFVFLLPLFIYFPPVPPSQRDALLETHSPIGLGQTKLEKKEAGKSPKKTAAATTINNLWIYPIKSCKGIQVSESKVLPSGLEFDRLYTFAQLKSPFPLGLDSPDDEKTAHKWEFITQRQFPLLATVHVDLYVPDVDKARGRPLDSKVSDSFLLVRFPWQERGLLGALSWVAAKIARGRNAVPEKEVILPVTFPSQREIEARGYTHEQVTIWRDTVTALNMEADLPRELRLYLGVSNRLGIFRIDPARLRQVFRCAPTQEEAGYQPVTGFQDAYPLHLLNLSSVRDFGAKIEIDDFQDLDPRRFRANIIVDGGDLSPYEEETWKKVRFTGGKHTQPSNFHVSCRTVRCKMPNVDQDSGHRHPVEPDRSLRRLREVDEGAKHKGCLGMQLTPLFDKTGSSAEEMESWVEVGMSVEVLEKGQHVYIMQ
ncbi:molybdenum cofactor sulfurase [Cladorrhinum sp. PSN332]|nr:molybdenum cofactor sulfurase [Cladorrhinum sp. PSN332]